MISTFSPNNELTKPSPMENWILIFNKHPTFLRFWETQVCLHRTKGCGGFTFHNASNSYQFKYSRYNCVDIIVNVGMLRSFQGQSRGHSPSSLTWTQDDGMSCENNKEELWNASAGNVHENHTPKTRKGLSSTGGAPLMNMYPFLITSKSLLYYTIKYIWLV